MLTQLDTKYLAFAQSQGQRSLSKVKRGVVLAKGNQILGVGYMTRLDPQGSESDEQKHAAVVNAETVAIGSAIQAGANVQGATLYGSHVPYWVAFKMLVTIGIKRMVFYGPLENEKINEYSRKLGIELVVVGGGGSPKT